MNCDFRNCRTAVRQCVVACSGLHTQRRSGTALASLLQRLNFKLRKCRKSVRAFANRLLKVATVWCCSCCSDCGQPTAARCCSCCSDCGQPPAARCYSCCSDCGKPTAKRCCICCSDCGQPRAARCCICCSDCGQPPAARCCSCCSDCGQYPAAPYSNSFNFEVSFFRDLTLLCNCYSELSL